MNIGKRIAPSIISVGKTGYMQKNEIRALSLTMHKLSSKWIKELKIRLYIFKLLETKIGKALNLQTQYGLSGYNSNDSGTEISTQQIRSYKNKSPQQQSTQDETKDDLCQRSQERMKLHIIQRTMHKLHIYMTDKQTK